jgi:hypothetical protein
LKLLQNRSDTARTGCYKSQTVGFELYRDQAHQRQLVLALGISTLERHLQRLARKHHGEDRAECWDRLVRATSQPVDIGHWVLPVDVFQGSCKDESIKKCSELRVRYCSL